MSYQITTGISLKEERAIILSFLGSYNRDPTLLISYQES